MEIRRRDFLKIAAGSSMLLAVGENAFAREPNKLLPGALGILYDATVCIGCKVCQVACKQANDMPVEHSSKDQIWDDPLDLSSKTLNIIKVYKDGTGETKDNEFNGYSFIKRHCMHCVDPACVSACPVSALKKNPGNGVVIHNDKACIGCRYCQVACPFNIPKFEWDKPFPHIRKCQLCDHRYKEGKFAACCEVCPTGASIFGNVSDLMEEARRRLELKPGQYYNYPLAHVKAEYKSYRFVADYQYHIYGEKEGGGTQYIMLAGVPFHKLGLPQLSDKPDATFSEGLQHTLYKGMIAPAVVLGGLLFAAYRSTQSHKDDE